MNAKQKKHTTEPYVSLATGNLCITVSALFTSGADGCRYILCVDFITAEESYNIELRLPSHMSVGQRSNIPGLLSRMSEEMSRDSLTDSFNRRYMEERLPVDIFNAEAEGQPLSVILTDIDCFKEVNDRFGHLAGDLVLKEFVKLSKQFIRKNSDWIARYGGDEFVIVLPGADGDIAGSVAEKIRLACQQAVVRSGSSAIRFTVSFGTHSVRGENVTMDALIGTADGNLYAAKKNGRNQTVGFTACRG
jgi:diguanylate cyclase (GGDEF)-like protein